ncbi:MAG TPA: ATP-binding protein [Myxococcota bacterium]|nr:ATP-binding protein [Myxococcota bacterium]
MKPSDRQLRGTADATAQLQRRRSRRPNYAAENRALVALAECMARSPHEVLDQLVRVALELCRAHSAGTSILEERGGEPVFCWRATAGRFAPLAGSVVPRAGSPCDAVLQRKEPMLLRDLAKHFPLAATLAPPVVEGLLVPFLVGDEPRGTLWVVSHELGRRFDREDVRVLTSLARFGSLALQTLSLRSVETALGEVERRFGKFMERLPGLAWIKDLDGRYVFVNDEAQQAFQLPRAQLLGRDDFEIFPADVAEGFRSNDAAALAHGKGIETIETLEHPDGPHHSLVAKFPIPGPDGEAAFVGGVAIDVTARMQAEDVLRESEERLRAMTVHSPAIIYMTQPDGYCTFLSEAWTSLTGRQIELGLGFGWANALHPDDVERTRAVFAPTPVPASFRIEFRMVHASGGYHWVIGSGAPRFGRNGEFLGYVGSVLDVDKEKQVEHVLREVDRRKDEFLAMLAHELRNPLAPIRNSLHVLRLAGDGPQSERVHEMLDRQVTHLIRLVDDLLEVARITSGKIELRRERVALHEIVRSALETSRPAIERAHHRLELDLPSEPIALDADAVRLSQVLANLLNNAAKYTEEGGAIWLRAERQGRSVAISVRDTGVGIPPAMQPRVFDLFTQVDRTLGRAQGGLGIGLALVKRLVEMHGGSVSVESTGWGSGSEFTVRLPLASSESLPERAAEDSSDSPGFAARRRFLVVDDNRDAADSLALLLRLQGIDAEVAYDGESALEAVRARRPEVVLLDLGMPGMDGFEIASRVRREPELADTVLIALTGWGQPEHRQKTREAGFDGHLVKPVELAELQSLVTHTPAPRVH